MGLFWWWVTVLWQWSVWSIFVRLTKQELALLLRFMLVYLAHFDSSIASFLSSSLYWASLLRIWDFRVFTSDIKASFLVSRVATWTLSAWIASPLLFTSSANRTRKNPDTLMTRAKAAVSIHTFRELDCSSI